MKGRPANDLERADAVIREHRLTRPSDPVGQYTYPRRAEERAALADFVYDVADKDAARAVLDAPTRRRVLWDPPHGTG